MKKLLAFLSLMSGAECFSSEQAPAILIDNTLCRSVWDILQNKDSNEPEREVSYNNKSLKNIDQNYRHILMDYAAFFVQNDNPEKAEENDMLLGRVIYELGWDLRELENTKKYQKKISTSFLANKIIAASLIAGGSSEAFEQEIKRDIDQLKDIIAMVEEDAFKPEEEEEK